ncbi:MAG: hypothetical protein JW863_15220 [Chitinispirillaceae bacterium]|nr:hypothetical protein [Chitinispirillaceae bacterium]
MKTPSPKQNLLIVILLAGLFPLYANNYKVSSTADLVTAVGNATAGDSIIVASGTYSCPSIIKLEKCGSAEKMIHLIGSIGNRPVLDFSSMAVESGNQGFKLSGNYWYIKGIIIKGAGDNGFLIQGGNSNVVDFCDFLENRDTGC